MGTSKFFKEKTMLKNYRSNKEDKASSSFALRRKPEIMGKRHRKDKRSRDERRSSGRKGRTLFQDT